MRILTVLALCATLLVAACAGSAPRSELGPDDLYAQAAEALEKKRYEKARELADRIRDDHPFSRFAVEAELLLADTAFREDKFEEAAAAYRSFEELHPTHPRVPYALFWRGAAYVNQSLPPGRDQTATRLAAEAFQKLLYAYPGSEFDGRARELIQEMRSKLAGHELKVARYYAKERQYRAALQRLAAVARDYPDTPEGAAAAELSRDLEARSRDRQ